MRAFCLCFAAETSTNLSNKIYFLKIYFLFLLYLEYKCFSLVLTDWQICFSLVNKKENWEYKNKIYFKILIYTCDEWGGAESRGNGARPVEWMIMNDTCATHRSRVPRRSSGRNKRRSDNSGRRERTRPGVLVCVLFAAVVREGLPLFCYVCLFD